MNIRVLGAHNCESQDSRFLCLLIDDILAVDAGALTSSLSFQSQQKLKAILLTHQHYDHIRDVPAIAINRFFQETTINIYSTRAVYDALAAHMLNDELYPRFMESPETNTPVRFKLVEPYKNYQIEGYTVLPVPVNHNSVTVGYQITSPEGKTLFYTADTGPGLDDCWEHVSPELLIVDVTFPNNYQQFAIKAGHLTPALLSKELMGFRKIKGYLPTVVVVHMNPILEKEIEAEIATVATNLNTSITLAHEGMELYL